MAGEHVGSGDASTPRLVRTDPPFGHQAASPRNTLNDVDVESRLSRRAHREVEPAKHVRLQAPEDDSRGTASSTSHIYLGSFGRSPRTSRSMSRTRRSIGGDSNDTPPASTAASPRTSISHSFGGTQVSAAHLGQLLENLNLELDTYGLEEFRDGFFDAMFFKPEEDNERLLLKKAEGTLPLALRKRHPLSLKAFFPRMVHEMKDATVKVTTTRAGIKLFKSFMSFFIAYILCLVPTVGNWLGPVNYVMPLSAIINHSGRPIGAQIDGALMTIAGTATGLGWGAFALYVSDSSNVAKQGYGGILATFLILFTGLMAAIRSYFIRSYQFVLTAGIAVIYTCLDRTGQGVSSGKFFDWGIPWLFGQAIALIVCFVVYPDAGARPLAVSLHAAFAVIEDGLKLPRPNNTRTRRALTFTFVNLSQAYRDLTLDISITRFHPDDIRILRNLMQAVIRALLSLKTETELFDLFNLIQEYGSGIEPTTDIEGNTVPRLRPHLSDDESVRLVASRLAEPTMQLLACMADALERCDAVIMSMSGYRKYLGPSPETSSDILGALTAIRKAMIRFDTEDDSLTDNPALPDTYSDRQEIVKLFLFVNPVRQASTTVEALVVKVMEMQQKQRGWRLFLPSYPFQKSLQRTNAQVRHDRGGATAGFFFRSQKQLSRQLQQIQKSTYRPGPRYSVNPQESVSKVQREETHDDHEIRLEEDTDVTKTTRHKIWLFLHGLQGFEMRFALKVVVVVSLLSIPAWLPQSSGWFNDYASWWAVVYVWIMMHPRVGGNFQDLVTRSLTALAGAIWAGFAYAARSGNPYVMAVFAAIFMLPMMYRFSQSTHPRSGVVGCISFTVVSLKAHYNAGSIPIVTLSWTLGVAFTVGICSAVIVNWLLFPFVARHELRKSISSMLLHLAIVYRGVVAKYIYYSAGEEPSIEDVSESELLEGRLREGFVRIRQLMALTRHEIRLRGAFDPLPYSALIEGCEAFFSHLVEVRQSSLFFHPNYMGHSAYASEVLLPFRRDAVASILMNLYCLAGALRGNRKVPRYLPSSAAARKRLLERMKEVEDEVAVMRAANDDSMAPEEVAPAPDKRGKGRKFAEVYQFAYSFALTECVEELEELKLYTKMICGEVGWDLMDEKSLVNT